MSDPCVSKELCKVKTNALEKAIQNLEIRVFEILKKSSQVSDMAMSGHKDALHAAVNSMQKEFDIVSLHTTNIEANINKLLKESKEDKDLLDSFKTRVLLLEEYIKILKVTSKRTKKSMYIGFALMVLFILSDGNWKQTYEFFLKIIF